MNRPRSERAARRRAPARALLACAAALAVAAPRLAAQEGAASMARSTVQVVCAGSDGAVGGSGFSVGDGTYVVTNWHVVACSAAGGRSGVAGAGSVAVHEVAVAWASPELDLALLRAPSVVGAPVRFATGEAVRETERVLAAGFPGAAEERGRGAGVLKYTAGIVSARVTDTDGRHLLQTDASINPGNSGGPLFDECGRVVGINVEKSLTTVLSLDPRTGEPRAERVPLGEGIGWAIEAGELFPILDRLGVPYESSRAPCAPGGNAASPAASARDARLTGWGVLAALACAAAALSLSLSQRGRTLARSAASRLTRAPSVRHARSSAPRERAPRAPARPQLRGVRGTLARQVVEIGTDPVCIGRDPGACNLVLSPADDRVSKRHCRVRYDLACRCFMLEDLGSSNGTFAASGERIAPGRPRPLLPGDRFYLATPECMFEVRMADVSPPAREDG